MNPASRPGYELIAKTAGDEHDVRFYRGPGVRGHSLGYIFDEWNSGLNAPLPSATKQDALVAFLEAIGKRVEEADRAMRIARLVVSRIDADGEVDPIYVDDIENLLHGATCYSGLSAIRGLMELITGGVLADGDADELSTAADTQLGTAKIKGDASPSFRNAEIGGGAPTSCNAADIEGATGLVSFNCSACGSTNTRAVDAQGDQ